MGKDRNGTFHPGKGKPSGANKEEGLGAQATPPERMDEYEEITDKYTDGPDELSDNVHVLHPNRNTSKANTSRGYGTRTSGKPDHEKEQEDNVRNRFPAAQVEASPPEELPGVFTKEAFNHLAAISGEYCVSVYIPTHEYGAAVNDLSDAVLFKNKLQDAQKILQEKGLKQPETDKLLGPGYTLMYDDDFWRSQSAGLAMFFAPGFSGYVKMSVSPPEQLVVNTSFQLSPLVQVMPATEDFYALVISKHTARLFKADATGMNTVPVTGLPDSTATNLPVEPDTTNGDTNYQGIGGASDTNITAYLKAIDDILFREVLHDQHIPLLMAGAEELITVYRSVSRYTYVYPEALTGNHEYDDTPALYKQARTVLQPYFNQELQKVKDRYANQSATGRTSSIIADIVPAAYYGQIDTLFVANNTQAWGAFDEMKNELHVDDSMTGNNEDLLNMAVIKTIANGGQVFLLEKDEMPAESPVAALMRY
ncbi:hypothetical protein [Chitinophaga sp. ARDCPP14]|uniref:baeRF3 domain-containing protein n=1 Tax=Chitinophaga sp. ARDCPP14 TaxID=3391139 RepID=UPI003F52597A